MAFKRAYLVTTLLSIDLQTILLHFTSIKISVKWSEFDQNHLKGASVIEIDLQRHTSSVSGSFRPCFEFLLQALTESTTIFSSFAYLFTLFWSSFLVFKMSGLMLRSVYAKRAIMNQTLVKVSV